MHDCGHILRLVIINWNTVAAANVCQHPLFNLHITKMLHVQGSLQDRYKVKGRLVPGSPPLPPVFFLRREPGIEAR